MRTIVLLLRALAQWSLGAAIGVTYSIGLAAAILLLIIVVIPSCNAVFEK